jgi:beta-lactamase superfamily II metal-dependent hydrolase
MSIVKSISVGHGDMFYIQHNSDNFTMIDCNLHEEFKNVIVNELIKMSKGKEIQRFISTSPDYDHIKGLKHIDEKMGIVNFYVVKNDAAKNEDNEDFKKYCELRDSSKAFFIKQGVQRKWMNLSDETRGSSGINIYWPDENNQRFKDALKKAEEGESPNNISPIFTYSLEDSGTIIWMGDLETPFMESIQDDLILPKADILIAPHHGRDSGKVPTDLLDKIKPKVIIIGEASSDDLNYYKGYNTITQNSAEDITMNLVKGQVHFFVSSTSYTVDFLEDKGLEDGELGTYLGTLDLSLV